MQETIVYKISAIVERVLDLSPIMMAVILAAFFVALVRQIFYSRPSDSYKNRMLF
jgi:uncharacterized membrane protein